MPEREGGKAWLGERQVEVLTFEQKTPTANDASLRRFTTVYPAAGDDQSAVPITPDRLQELRAGRRVEISEPLMVER